MSHEFMMTSFMAYTDGSTKDQSNDQIGGWGIGSKSPFSYTDQFVLVSVHDGVRSVYSVFKDEDSIPAIALLSQEETTDANGVERSEERRVRQECVRTCRARWQAYHNKKKNTNKRPRNTEGVMR